MTWDKVYHMGRVKYQEDVQTAKDTNTAMPKWSTYWPTAPFYDHQATRSVQLLQYALEKAGTQFIYRTNE